MPKFICPKDNHAVPGCGIPFEAEPERDGTVECPNCGVWHDTVAQQSILAAAETDEEGSCPDRAAFGSCSHESCAEADRFAVRYFECHDCGAIDHSTSKCSIEKTIPRENEDDPDDEDLPGISAQERARLQAIDDADDSEHRPGVGKIVCKFCGLRSCDYVCDGSQADEIAAENDKESAILKRYKFGASVKPKRVSLEECLEDAIGLDDPDDSYELKVAHFAIDYLGITSDLQSSSTNE